MISGQQHLWDFPSAEFSGPRVLRPFQQTAAEAVVRSGLIVAENSWQQAHDRIDKNHRGDGAIRENIIADRNLGIDQIFDYAMIDSFVMATDDDEV